MLVIANNLSDDSLAISEIMLAMVDENLERNDRLKLISRAKVVQLVSQLHNPNVRNHLLSNISLAVDSGRPIIHISVDEIRIEVASIIRIGLAYKFVPKSSIYLKALAWLERTFSSLS